MLKTEVWLVIRDLYSQGFGTSKISEITGHDRKTVRKYLRLKAAPEPQKCKTRPSKLDLYKDYIMEKFSEGPYTAAQFFHEIKEIGFDGEETIVKDFVRTVRLQQEMLAVLLYDLEGKNWGWELLKLKCTVGFPT